MTNAILGQRATSLPARIGVVVAGTAILALAAKVQVPFWPVPMTLQTLAVLMIGAAYGARMAGATLIAYLVEGAIGLPVFATGAGVAYMAGPTGGYLLGFLLAAAAVGLAADRGLLRALPSAIAVFLVAEVLIYAPGILWLSGFIGIEKAIAGGLVPFLPAEAFKLALAVILARVLTRRASR